MDTGKLDLAAEQRGQFPADCEAQSGAAVFSRRPGICLLERLKDNALLLRRDADTSVLDGERHDLAGFTENRVIDGPALCGECDAHVNMAAGSEFDGV